MGWFDFVAEVGAERLHFFFFFWWSGSDSVILNQNHKRRERERGVREGVKMK